MTIAIYERDASVVATEGAELVDHGAINAPLVAGRTGTVLVVRASHQDPFIGDPEAVVQDFRGESADVMLVAPLLAIFLVIPGVRFPRLSAQKSPAVFFERGVITVRKRNVESFTGEPRAAEDRHGTAGVWSDENSITIDEGDRGVIRAKNFCTSELRPRFRHIQTCYVRPQTGDGDRVEDMNAILFQVLQIVHNYSLRFYPPALKFSPRVSRD